VPMPIEPCITLGSRFQLESLGEMLRKVWGRLQVNLEVWKCSPLGEQCCQKGPGSSLVEFEPRMQ